MAMNGREISMATRDGTAAMSIQGAGETQKSQARDSLSADLASLRLHREESPPKRGLGWRVGAGLAAAAALVGGGLLAWPPLEARLFKTEVAITRVTLVSPVAASTSLTASGYVVPQVLSKVAPKIPGRVSKVHVKEGDTVSAGQVLMELDATDQSSQLAQARSRLAAAQARVVTAQANLEEVRVQLERERRLAAVGASARSTLEDLEARQASLKAAVDAAQAEVKVAQTELLSAQTALDEMTIRAPIAGTVIHKPMQVGEVVGYSTTGVQMSLVDIADLATNLVEVDVPEGRLHLIRPGAPAEISLDAFPGRRLRGEVAAFGKQVDRAKATLTVKVRFLDDMAGVLPDMSARVSFLTERPSEEQLRAAERPVVPASAVAERSGSKAVLVIDEGGQVRWQPVELGEAVGGGFVVKAGPKPGTRLVDRPPPTLQDGMKIKERIER
jgi:RND family efflux transporter MFP subunit